MENLHNFLLLNIYLIPKLRKKSLLLLKETNIIKAWVLRHVEEGKQLEQQG